MRECKYCGKPVEGLGFVCNECRPYTRFSLGKKLGLEGTPKEVYFKAIKLFKELYEAGESTLTIAARLGIPDETVWYNLRKFGLTRDLQEAQTNAYLEGRKELPQDKEELHYHHGYHISWTGERFWYRSGWEDEYASELDSKQIQYRMEGIRLKYWDSVKKKERVAIPDFYLPETNELVEIKCTHTYDEQNMRDKFKAYRKAGYVPKLILNKQEKVL